MSESLSYPDIWNAAIDRAQEELVRQDQFSERTLRILDEQRIERPVPTGWQQDFAASADNLGADHLEALAKSPQPPTREQIAAEVKRVTHAWSGPSMDEFINDPPTRKQYAIADAVLALIQNGAEPLPVMAETSLGRMPLADALAPRIEDMTPGTTFRMRRNNDSVWHLWCWTGRALMRIGANSTVQGAISDMNIDPSTIRDVTPPKEPTA